MKKKENNSCKSEHKIEKSIAVEEEKIEGWLRRVVDEVEEEYNS